MSVNDQFSSDEEDGASFNDNGGNSSSTKLSSVFLGFVDTEIESEGDLPTIEDTFAGGQPVWLHPDSKPSNELLKCLHCKNPLSLIIQAFAPLEGALYDRVIYVFGCSKSACNRQKGSVRVIKGISKDPNKIDELVQKEQEEIKNQLDAKLKLDDSKNFLFDTKTNYDKSNSQSVNPFGASSNPFGGASSNPFASTNDSSSSTNPFGTTKVSPSTSKASSTKKTDNTFASVASKAAPKPQSKPQSPDIELPEYPGYFLYVEKEKFNNKKAKESNKLPGHLQIDDSVLDTEAETISSSSKATGTLNPESQAISNSLQDKVFQHFSEVVSHNPLQVLRYDLGGKPLLFSANDQVANAVAKNLIPNPSFHPSSQRQFELQIMPKLIIDFEKDEKLDISSGIEWATIIVYTDVEDFIPSLDENHVGYVEEWVGVQWEELVQRRK